MQNFASLSCFYLKLRWGAFLPPPIQNRVPEYPVQNRVKRSCVLQIALREPVLILLGLGGCKGEEARSFCPYHHNPKTDSHETLTFSFNLLSTLLPNCLEIKAMIGKL